MVSSITTQRVLQSYLGNKPKVDSAVLLNAQPTGVATAQNSTASTQVNFSLAARSKQALTSPVALYQQQLAESKKTKARARVAEIKQRVDELKRLVSLFGAMAPKALLRELQQLAGELKSAAKELKEGWGSSSSGGAVAVNLSENDVTAAEISDDSVNDAAAEELFDEAAADETSTQIQAALTAEEAASLSSGEPAEAALAATAMASVLQHTEKEQTQQQRREDQRLLQETVQELKSLFNRLKAMLRQEERNKDTEKQLDNISKQLMDTDNIASQLTTGINASIPMLHIAVSV